MRYYTFDNIEKRNKLFNWIITPRDSGKTIAVKKKMVDVYLNGGKSIYVRRRKVECENNKLENFFVKMQKVGYHTELELFYDNQSFYHKIADDAIEPIAHVIPLSTSINIRSVDYIGVTDIFFEEFVIKETATHRYLKDEVIMFLELYMTLYRDLGTDIRCWFIGNNIQTFNPYFLYFDIFPKENGIKTWGEHAIEYWTNKEMIDELYSTRFGTLIKGTSYADYAIENKSFENQQDFIIKNPKTCGVLFNVLYNDKKYTVYMLRGLHNVVIANYNGNNETTVALTDFDNSTECITVKGLKGRFESDYYISSLKLNQIYYLSEKHQEIGRILNKSIYF